MLKYLVIILLSSLGVKAQIYIKPNNSYGIIQNRGRFDSTFLYPSGCGAPTGMPTLRSIDQHMPALYYDTCGHKMYNYDPMLTMWFTAGSATQLSDSAFQIGRDTIVIRGTGGGGGGGAPSGPAGGDLTGTYPNPTIPQLTQKSEITGLEGVLYSKSSWTDPNDFVKRGSFTATASGGAINFSGGSNDFTKTLDLDTTMRERYVIHIEEKAGTINSTSDGLGIGTQSINPSVNYGISAIIITNNTSNEGKLLLFDVQGNSVIATSSGALSFSAGDTLAMDFERDRLTIKATAYNKTTGSASISVSYTYSITYPVSHVLPNTGTISIFNVAGNNSMTSFTVTSKEAKNSALCIIGDSKLWYYAGSSSLGMLLDNVFRPTNIHGGPGDDLTQLLAAEDDIINQSPINVAISEGSNDIGHGNTVSQTFTKYKKYVSRLTNAGINVFHLLPLYQPTIVAELDSLADSIRAYYPAGNIIDCRTPLRYCSSCYMAADNVHPNEAAQLVLYNTIINSGKLASYYKTPVASVAGSSSLTLDNVLTNGNSSTQSMNLSGSNTTDSKLKVGSLELQPYAVNNGWVGENTYFDGTNWKYRATGYAERFHFQNGYIFFETAPSGSAGANVSWTLPMLADPSGNIGLGNLNPASPLYSDGVLNITSSDGKINIPGYNATDSRLMIGSVEMSPHSFNNFTLADNSYFDGTNWKRRATGYASMFHLQNGFAYISTAGTSSAGSNITWTLPFLTDESGNVGLGGMNQASPSYSGASLYIPVADGKVHITNMDSTAGPANIVWRDPATKELKLAALPLSSSDLTAGPIKTNVQIVSDADYSVASTDYIIIYSNLSTARTLTLPSASTNTNRVLIIAHGGGGTSNINLSASIRENSTTTVSAVNQGYSYTIVSTGSEWYVASVSHQ